jgi:hypothetical protein
LASAATLSAAEIDESVKADAFRQLKSIAMKLVDDSKRSIVSDGIDAQLSIDEGWTETRTGGIMWSHGSARLTYMRGEVLTFSIAPVWNEGIDPISVPSGIDSYPALI